MFWRDEGVVRDGRNHVERANILLLGEIIVMIVIKDREMVCPASSGR